MAHFYGVLRGSRGEATKTGGKSSGLVSLAAGWGGCIRTQVWHDDETGKDMYRITLEPWHGSGGATQEIARGVLDATVVLP